MRSLLRSNLRRSAAAAGIYLSVGFGFLATVLTKRQLDSEHFGLLTIVIVVCGSSTPTALSWSLHVAVSGPRPGMPPRPARSSMTR